MRMSVYSDLASSIPPVARSTTSGASSRHHLPFPHRPSDGRRLPSRNVSPRGGAGTHTTPEAST